MKIESSLFGEQMTRSIFHVGFLKNKIVGFVKTTIAGR